MKLIYYMGLLAIFVILIIVYYSTIGNYKRLNSEVSERKTINKNVLPLIEDNSKFIELQTKRWIKERLEDKPCYGMLEKDKIIMTSWMEKFQIRCPKIHFYDYHYNFTKDDLAKVMAKKISLIIKISHLQSNYGIILVKKNDDIDKVYEKCLEKFKTCFVCNHDDNKPPTNAEIKNGKKESYYKLYESIEPGIIIQDFFHSFADERETKPIEFKIMMIGDKIINGASVFYSEKMKNVYAEARRISALLGSGLVRVDFFVKESDDPFIPYLNEISLSPNGGLGRAKFLTTSTINEFKKEIEEYEEVDMPEIDKLIRDCPKRSIPIEKYLTDAESVKDKFNFAPRGFADIQSFWE